MVKTASWASVATALFCIGVWLGVNYEIDRHKSVYLKAMQLCERPAYGTAYVSYRNGGWHCFYRGSQYPYRISFSTLVLEGTYEDQ